ncbi:hypothetical protein FZEAL_774 [Fusarium zealandicum]|uniref:Nephrocystin 3-like N-terminal domain-containing protein n=1 Tax=Fusarium zealandicum TaxID=1053134 RepID=A0A8H4UU10_9HYPO|nr:hypothetical protein FZEAL_774 [Fusarium zealandicum]
MSFAASSEPFQAYQSSANRNTRHDPDSYHISSFTDGSAYDGNGTFSTMSTPRVIDAPPQPQRSNHATGNRKTMTKSIETTTAKPQEGQFMHFYLPSPHILLLTPRFQALPAAEPDIHAGQAAFLGSFMFSAMTRNINATNSRDTQSCEWLFNDPSFSHWSTSKHGLLWLRGPQGSGKSTLLRQAMQSTLDTEPDSVHLYYAFTSNGTDLPRSRLGLLRALLYQLVPRFPEVFDDLKAKFERIKAALTIGQRVSWSAQELFDELIKSLPRILKTQSLRIYIDSNDHCGDDAAKKLLQDFAKLTQKSPTPKNEVGVFQGIGILFSSIDYPLKAPFPLSSVQLDDKNGPNITRYVRHQLYNMDPGIHDTILTRAGGSFLSARLLVTYFKLCNTLPSSIAQQPSPGAIDLPSTLDALFQDIVFYSGGQASTVFKWCCLSSRPLTLAELRIALAMEAPLRFATLGDILQAPSFIEHGRDTTFESWIKITSWGLLEIVVFGDQKVVKPVHESIASFFISKGLAMLSDSFNDSQTPDELVAQAHQSLANCCIRYLVLAFKEAGCDGENSGHPALQFVEHAGSAWSHHLVASNLKTSGASKILQLMEWPSQSILDGFIKLELQESGVLDVQPLLTPTLRDTPAGAMWAHFFALLGHVHLLLAVVKKAGQVTLEIQDAQKGTPLHLAALRGHSTVLKQLIKKGADTSIQAAGGQTALHFAILQDHAGAQKVLIEHNPELVSVLNDMLQTPLFSAVLSGSPSSLKLLFDKGADARVQDYLDSSLLHYGAIMGKSSLFQLLLERGADINAQNADACTPLHIAILENQTSIVRLLLNQGARADVTDNIGRTALHVASLTGNKTCVQRLLENKVSVDAKDSYGQSALVYAVQGRHANVVKMLLGAKANINARDQHGFTVLILAVLACDEKLAKVLLEASPDLERLSPENYTVIVYALYRENGVSQLSEEEQSMASLLFKRYGKRYTVWHSEWKKCHETFLSEYGNKKQASKPNSGSSDKQPLTKDTIATPQQRVAPQDPRANTQGTPQSQLPFNTRSQGLDKQTRPVSELRSMSASTRDEFTGGGNAHTSQANSSSTPLCLVPGGHMRPQGLQMGRPGGPARVSSSPMPSKGDYENRGGSPFTLEQRSQTIMETRDHTQFTRPSESPQLSSRSNPRMLPSAFEDSSMGHRQPSNFPQSLMAGPPVSRHACSNTYVAYSTGMGATPVETLQKFNPIQQQGPPHPSVMTPGAASQAAKLSGQPAYRHSSPSGQAFKLQNERATHFNMHSGYSDNTQGPATGVESSSGPQSRPSQPLYAQCYGQTTVRKPMPGQKTITSSGPPQGITRKALGGDNTRQFASGQSGQLPHGHSQQQQQQAMNINTSGPAPDFSQPTGFGGPQSHVKPNTGMPRQQGQQFPAPVVGPRQSTPNLGSIGGVASSAQHGGPPPKTGMPLRKKPISSAAPPAGGLPVTKKTKEGEALKQNRLDLSTVPRGFPVSKPKTKSLGQASGDKKPSHAEKTKSSGSRSLFGSTGEISSKSQESGKFPGAGTIAAGGAGLATGAIGSYLISSHIHNEHTAESHTSNTTHHSYTEHNHELYQSEASVTESIPSSPVNPSEPEPSESEPSDLGPSDPELSDPERSGPESSVHSGSASESKSLSGEDNLEEHDWGMDTDSDDGPQEADFQSEAESSDHGYSEPEVAEQLDTTSDSDNEESEGTDSDEEFPGSPYLSDNDGDSGDYPHDGEQDTYQSDGSLSGYGDPYADQEPAYMETSDDAQSLSYQEDSSEEGSENSDPEQSDNAHSISLQEDGSEDVDQEQSDDEPDVEESGNTDGVSDGDSDSDSGGDGDSDDGEEVHEYVDQGAYQQQYYGQQEAVEESAPGSDGDGEEDAIQYYGGDDEGECTGGEVYDGGEVEDGYDDYEGGGYGEGYY